jgi:hypothetical protein
MDKNELRAQPKMTDMSAIETDPDKLVAEASGWAQALWTRAAQMYGHKQDTAMHTAANWADVPPTTLWRLRYRRPRGLDIAVYFRLKAAHQKHVESVEGKLAENLIALRALPATPDRQRLAADLEKFLGLTDGEEVRPPAQRTD